MNSNVIMQKLVLIAPLVARTVLYLLIALSVLSIGIIIERWWFFRRRRDDFDRLAEDVRLGLARGDLPAVKKRLAVSRSVEAEIVGEAVDWYGEGVDSVEGETMEVLNPATGETIAEVPRGTAKDVDRAVAAAKKALPEWLETTPGERAELLLKLADALD